MVLYNITVKYPYKLYSHLMFINTREKVLHISNTYLLNYYFSDIIKYN